MALFGIKKIEYCAADSLAFSGGYNPFMGISSELTNTLTTISCLVNTRATLAIEQQRNTKEVLYTSRLVFVTPADPKLSASYFAFVATTNEGERILLGAPFRPRVVVTTEQTVAAGASDLTAYTTTVVFQTNYCPLRLPVTAATPVAGPAYDICCGAIKTEEPISGPAYDVCCGAIKTEEPISGPAYDICCGEIVGEAPPPENVRFHVTVQRLSADDPSIFVGLDEYVYNSSMQVTHRTPTLVLPQMWQQEIDFTMLGTPQPYATDSRAYFLRFAVADPASQSFFNYKVVSSDFADFMAAYPAATPIYNEDNVQIGFQLAGFTPPS